MASQPERGPGGPQGSDLNVLHTERDMTVYVLTESDLDRLGDLGINAAAFSALATFFGGLWLDLAKDLALASNIPEATKIALAYVQPLLLILALVFGAFASYFWYKRNDHKAKIQRESKSKSRVTGEVRSPAESS